MKKKYYRSSNYNDSILIPVLGVLLTIIPLILVSVNFIDINSILLSIPDLQSTTIERPRVIDKTSQLLSIKMSTLNLITFYKGDRPIKTLRITNDAQKIYNEVTAYLSEYNREKTHEIVFIDIADSLKYEILVELIDACKETGFANVNIIK